MSNAKKLLEAAAGTAAAGGGGLDIDDVFSTFLNSDGSSNQQIINNIDLAGEGGLVWGKSRNLTEQPFLVDSARGKGSNNNFKYLRTTSAAQQQDIANRSLSSMNSNGFTFQGADSQFNASGNQYVYWTWRKAPKFFDIVTYTGTGSIRTVSHNLGSVPGMITVKRTDSTASWRVYHRGSNATAPEDYYLTLNATDQAGTGGGVIWNDTAPTDSVFTVGANNSVNADGGTFVAYLFAHNNNDGEFGPDGDADVIKCGSYTGAALPNEINVGFEPQFVMIKNASHAGDWVMFDAMRGVVNSAYPNLDNTLFANSTAAERTNTGYIGFTPTGFLHQGGSADTNTANNEYIFMAIRRGSLAVATDPTKVFKSIAYTGSGSGGGNKLTTGFPVDLAMIASRTGTQSWKHAMISRLSSGDRYIPTNSNVAEVNNGSGINLDDMTGYDFDGSSFNGSGPFISHNWKRAPGHFDVATYSGSSSAKTVRHNLTVTPEMMWVKSRSNANRWTVFHKDMGPTKRAFLDLTQAFDTGSGIWNNTAPTSTVFTVGTDSNTNYSGHTFISYLFATAPGVSKVGSASHSGTTNVSCGFASGARFVMLKRTDAAGAWFCWDSVRGIVSGNDPYLLLDSTAAEVTNTDYIDPLSSGFTITSSFTAGTYIFYAIA